MVDVCASGEEGPHEGCGRHLDGVHERSALVGIFSVKVGGGISESVCEALAGLEDSGSVTSVKCLHGVF